MNNYISFKETRLEHIGSIPSEWKVKRLKYLTKVRKELSLEGKEELLSVSEFKGIIKRKDLIRSNENLSRSENLVGYKVVYKGDLVNNIMLVWKGGLGVSQYDGIVSPAYSVFSFNKNCHPEYFNYLLKSDSYITEFTRNSKGIIMSRLRLYDDSFGGVFSHLPPLNEQKIIAIYLYKKTKQIDYLIETIRRKIDLLNEKRKTYINQYVTKGMGTFVEMKESGSEFIGLIPKHWKIKKLAFLGKFSKGKNVSKSDLKETGIPVILYSEIYTKYNRIFNKADSFINKDKSENSTKLSEKAFLFTSSGETIEDIGKSLLYDGTDSIFVGGDIIIFKLEENIDLEFLSFFLNSNQCRQFKASISKGEIIVHIYEKQLREIKICIPPIKEQKQIVNFLKKYEKNIEKINNHEIKKINLLQEFRNSLISSVVTGKVRISQDMI